MKSFKSMALGMGLLLFAGCGTQAQNENAAGNAEEQENVVIETIMARRSIRQYKDMPVEREKLEQIVECGINAPNGGNFQPWEVRVVDDAEYIDGITEIFKKASPQMASDPSFKNMFRNAPAVIFIASPQDGSGQIDCGLMGENMILAAQSMGLGTCCLGGPIAFMKSNEEVAPYLEKLEISEGYQLLYAIAIGYPDEAPEAKPRETAKVKFVD